MNNKPLTLQQAAVLDCIKSFISNNGYPLSVREIAEKMGYSSASTAFQLVKQLSMKGYINKGNGPRVLQVVEQEGEAQEREAADVANRAMMIADKARRIIQEEEDKS